MPKILVTGGTGMLGRALKKIIPDATYWGRKECDLTGDYNSVLQEIRFANPDIIIHLAARVAGLEYNMAHPVEQVMENVQINTNVLRAAHELKVPRLLGMASTCIYPDNLPEEKYPLSESMLHQGAPPMGNFEYAYAKRLMCVQIDAYKKQYGYNWSYLIPSNMYGPGDNYKVGQSHFIAHLIRELHSALARKAESITLPGTGAPLRQFVFSEDVARVIKSCIDIDMYRPMNVACPQTYSYLEYTDRTINSLGAGWIGYVRWDKTKPDGQYRKDADSSRLYKILPGFSFTPFHQGVKKTWEDYTFNMNYMRATVGHDY